MSSFLENLSEVERGIKLKPKLSTGKDLYKLKNKLGNFSLDCVLLTVLEVVSNFEATGSLWTWDIYIELWYY